MSITYEVCKDRDVIDLLNDVIDRWHPDLVEGEVKFLVQWAIAEPDEKTGEIPPALKLHGVPALAIVKNISPEDRAAGLPDIRLKIDKSRWNELTSKQQMALLDHEASHVCCKRDQEGAIVSDDRGRPKTKIIPADFQLDGFAPVIKRHGEDSLEIVNLRSVFDRFVQPNFEWEAVGVGV